MNTATLTRPLAESLDPHLAERLDAATQHALTEHRIVGSVVLVVRQGRVVYRRAAGLADREAGRAMRDDAIFLLSSVTKLIVSTTAMRLIEQGRLALDDAVARWLPGFRPHLADGSTPVLTVRQLLTHTAGLNYSFMEPPDGPYRRLGVSNGLDMPGLAFDTLLQRIAEAPLVYAPGTDWGYSMATDVLGAVIEAASGLRLPEAVRQGVTAPLAMHDTDFGVAALPRLVTHYGDGKPEPVRMQDEQIVLYEGRPVSFSPRRLFDARSYPSGGAGMAGTASDVMVLLETLRRGGGPLLRPETVAAMAADHVGPQAQTQGPGWGFGYASAVLVDPAAADSPQSAGTLQWGGAYGHNWFIDPAQALSVVALTNTGFEGMTGRYTQDVRDAIYDAA